MAKARAAQNEDSRILHEVEAIICAAIGSWLTLSFLSYTPESPGINDVGPVGYSVANFLIQCFGYAAYLFPALLITASLILFTRREASISLVRAAGGFFSLLVAAVALGLYRPHVSAEAAGGWIGGFLATVLEQAIGRGGSAVLIVALALLIFMMVTGRTVSGVAAEIAAALRAALAMLRSRGAAAAARLVAWCKDKAPMLLGARRGGSALREAKRRRALENPPVVHGIEESGGALIERPAQSALQKTMSSLSPSKRGRGAKKEAKVEPEQEEFVFDIGDGDFRLPPVKLLGDHDDRSDYVSDKDLVSQSDILERKLATFGVEGRVTAVRPGPVITTYEFEPEPGIKLSRVVNLCDDLTMALRAHGVRIVAPIPGKNVVGIEVANRNRAIVGLRDLIDSREFTDSKYILPLALGRDTTGVALQADLAKMPHLLMAGATGTGKSVALNAFIVSILYRATPREVRFIMIDPKMLELSLFEGIPHLLVPVVTDVKKSAAALHNVMREMERRFEMLKDKRVRSLDDYNRRIAEEARAKALNGAAKKAGSDAAGAVAGGVDAAANGHAGTEGAVGTEGAAGSGEPTIVHEHLPRIVVVIDELADLMMSVGREIEESITRLAQKARAAGIHLIVATQRPSVDVITGLIKANFPSRISFQVTARPDSRTILDAVGAERLLGNGDLLFMAPTTSFLQRLHGGLITDREISNIVEYLKAQGEPDYRMEMLEAPGGADGEDEEEEFFDELYDRAVDLVTKHGQGSTSWVQRKLGIGYNRAARIMEHMEREGVVGPGDGSRPREVLARAIEA